MIAAVKDTIAAISTPIGFGGIGIVRLSGPESDLIARKIFRRIDPRSGKKTNKNFCSSAKEFVPRRLYHGYVVDPENQSIFNEVLMVFMPSPNSYTREDVVEIQAHGGTAALTEILELVIRAGARLADPGEFTRRAYLNGRIDLSQAEAIIDVIQAKTDAALRIANRNLEGDVGKTARAIRKGLLEMKAMLEAQIDFPEDVDETIDVEEICRKIKKELLQPIKEIIEGYKHGHLFREGVKIVIAGRTNVGKSSLLNSFLKQDRAIVTSFHGTTRDCIEESINLFGLYAVVVDTAGWRNTNDPVEKIGIERSRTLAHNADLILFMIDAGSGIVQEDENLYQKIQKKVKILVINKNDLLNDGQSVTIPEHWHFSESQYTSAKFGYGLDSLKEKIFKELLKSDKTENPGVVPNIRQKNLFLKAQKAIESALKGIHEQIHPELIAIDIQEAIDVVDEITGDSVKTDILDEIFSRFCIGK